MRVQARVRLSCCWILPRHSYEPCLIRTEIGHVGCCKRLPSRPGFQLRSLRLTEGVNGGEKQIPEDRCHFSGCYFQESERTTLAVPGGPSTRHVPPI
jgi:hypothetical protein